MPDFVYFNHSVHVNRGISCVECHGQINQMDEVHHAQPLSMTFCLDCHRNPGPNLRPLDKITDLAWNPQRWRRDNVRDFLEQWAARDLDAGHASEIAALLEEGTRFKPEKVIGLMSQVAAAAREARSGKPVPRMGIRW